MPDPAADRLLRDFLESSTDADSERHLTILLDDVASPIIRRVVASALRSSHSAEDAEDVVSDTLVRLLRHLRVLRRETTGSIADFHGYVAMCAYHSCHQRLHEKYPARNRLRNHLRYLLRHDDELALWHVDDGRLACGFRSWRGHQPAPADRTAELRMPARSDRTAENRVQIARLVRQIFLATGLAMELDQLVNVIARSIDLEQERMPLEPSIASNENGVESDLDVRLSLRELWQDVALLSQRQRVALLLNLRDREGVEVLSLVIDTRTASMDDIARALEMPVGDLTAIWSELPLSDAVIARILAVSPQQVIKFRRLARERLRRLAKRREQQPPSRQHEVPMTSSFALPRLAARRLSSTE